MLRATATMIIFFSRSRRSPCCVFGNLRNGRSAAGAFQHALPASKPRLSHSTPRAFGQGEAYEYDDREG